MDEKLLQIKKDQEPNTTADHTKGKYRVRGQKGAGCPQGWDESRSGEVLKAQNLRRPQGFHPI